MLVRLNVENFAVVSHTQLDFSEGLNIITGETGAGKSILIDAIGVFLKKKISDNLIRDRSRPLMVQALFIKDNEEVVLKRELSGKNKLKTFSFINGEMVTFNQLKDKAEQLLNIYGQNEHVFLLNSRNHKVFLDNFIGNEILRGKLNHLCNRLSSHCQALKELRALTDKAAEKLDFLHFQINEIDNLGLDKDADVDLEQRQKILASAEEIISRSDNLMKEFYQDDASVYSKLYNGMKDLEFLKEIYPELGNMYKEFEAFYANIEELSAELSTIMGNVDYSEEDLNEVEKKLLELNRLKKKYSTDLNGLLEKKGEFEQERQDILNTDFSIKEEEDRIQDLLKGYREINHQLRVERESIAKELSRMVEKELAKLEMKRAVFKIDIQENEPTINNFNQDGTDVVEFYLSSNPGQKPGRIKEVASGGELSRLMLVLMSIVWKERDSTYIFDEIDTGIGGKTAEFVGEKLRKISKSNQVLCISHLPQIVSFSDKHFQITKQYKDNQTFSKVRELEGQARIEEIARLMAGGTVNDDVLKAARNLIDSR